MKILFMGTSEFAVPSLQKLWSSKHDVIGVITQPDRPGGRGRKTVLSPVKRTAIELGINVYQPTKIKSEEAVNEILRQDIDLIVVASYGQIIPVSILNYPRLGCINVHASLLPAYRGAAPIQRAIMAGEKVTGITIMFMDEGLDTGDIITQVPVKIDETMDHGELENLLATCGAELLADTLVLMENGAMTRHKQESASASYAPRLNREEERILWENNAVSIVNKIRGLSPLPGAYTLFNSDSFKVFAARAYDNIMTGKPGEIVRISADGFEVQTGKGIVTVLEVQRAGKRRMPAKEFLQGFNLKQGDVLG